MADIAASVLAKLRNKAKASGISYQQCLQLFVQEEFLRKLSKSGCEDTLIPVSYTHLRFFFFASEMLSS